MPSNVEIKARIPDSAVARAIAHRLSGAPPEIIPQHDIFFSCKQTGSRLKLRILAPDRGELILYDRPDIAGIRTSQYTIARTADPTALREILAASLGIIGEVKKRRTLYLVGQTRVHIDEVEKLGDFLELEVVLRPGQVESEGRQIAQGLMAEFAIAADQLIAQAYFDLLPK